MNPKQEWKMNAVRIVAMLSLIFSVGEATYLLFPLVEGCVTCQCYNKMGQYGRQQNIVNCSVRGLSSIPSHLPQQIHDLDLSQNELGNSSLGPLQVHRDSLSSLSLSYNKITNINDTVLTSLTNLDTLDLTGNLLNKVGEYFLSSLNLRKLIGIHSRSFAVTSFKGLKGLEYLSMVFEQSEIHADIFKELSVATLDVTFKVATQIPGSLFHFGINTLTTLTIDGPKLVSLPDDLFAGLTLLKTLTLHGDNIRLLQEIIFKNGVPLTLFKIKITGIKSLSRNILREQRNLKFVSLNSIEDIPPLYLPNQLDLLDMTDSQIFKICPSLFTTLHNLRKLILVNASITSLENHSFNGLKSLSFLNLSRNDLSDLPAEIFEACRNTLESLDLSYNRIQFVTSIYFNSIKSLRHLNLSNNKIKSISPDAFNHLRMLTSLNCAENFISELPEKLFQNVESLQTIDLSFNNIYKIDRSNFVASHHLQYMNLANNPLNCNCDISMMKKRLRYVYIDGICQSPAEHVGTLVRNLEIGTDCSEIPETQQLTTDLSVPEMSSGMAISTTAMSDGSNKETISTVAMSDDNKTTATITTTVINDNDQTKFSTTHTLNTSDVTQETILRTVLHFEIDDIHTWNGSAIAIVCILATIIFSAIAISVGLLSKTIFEKCQRSGTYILPPPKVRLSVYGSEENIFSL